MFNTTGCLLDYHYFKENCKLTAIDLSKQEELDAYPKSITQINFTESLNRPEKNQQCCSLLKKWKKLF